MLSTTNQLDAYKKLVASGGLTTAPSYTKSVITASKATTLVSTLQALALPSSTQHGIKQCIADSRLVHQP